MMTQSDRDTLERLYEFRVDLPANGFLGFGKVDLDLQIKDMLKRKKEKETSENQQKEIHRADQEAIRAKPINLYNEYMI